MEHLTTAHAECTRALPAKHSLAEALWLEGSDDAEYVISAPLWRRKQAVGEIRIDHEAISGPTDLL